MAIFTAANTVTIGDKMHVGNKWSTITGLATETDVEGSVVAVIQTLDGIITANPNTIVEVV